MKTVQFSFGLERWRTDVELLVKFTEPDTLFSNRSLPLSLPVQSTKLAEPCVTRKEEL